MAVVSKINLYEQPEQSVLATRATIHFNDFPQIAGEAYRKVEEYAAQKGLLFAGGPYVCYHNADLENLDVEMGFPVARPVEGSGDIQGNTIPPRKVVAGIFRGPYEETDPLMLEIMQWIAAHGFEQQGMIINEYLNDEDRPREELLTRIVIPVK